MIIITIIIFDICSIGEFIYFLCNEKGIEKITNDGIVGENELQKTYDKHKQRSKTRKKLMNESKSDNIS